MNSKKAILLTAIIAIIIFNSLVFLLPFNRNTNFLIVYVSSMISIVLTCGVFMCTLTKKGINKKINNLPLDWVAWGYFILQSILSIVELTKDMDYRTSLLINIILLGISAIFLAFVNIGKKEITRVDEKVKSKVFFIKSLKLEIDSMIGYVTDLNIKSILQNLLDTVEYSDPMTHSALAEIENKITVCMQELRKIVNQNPNNEEEIKSKISEIQMYMLERNNKAKLYKGTPETEEVMDKPVNYKVVSFICVLIVVSMIIGITVYFTVLVPNNKYNDAMKLLEEKHYIEAHEAFEKLEKYKNSEEMSNKAISLYNEEKYKHAIELFENKDYSKAAEQFLSLDDYKDSKDKLIEIYNLFGDKDVVYFGKYNGKPIAWQILDTREHKVLLITKDSINEMAYNTEYKSISWENSSLRKWLNQDFYNCFDENEKSRILKNTAEIDNVFLLSSKNIKSYNKLRNASGSWWIESQGDENTKAMYVTENGEINTSGDIVTKLHGVRPSIWLDLD